MCNVFINHCNVINNCIIHCYNTIFVNCKCNILCFYIVVIWCCCFMKRICTRLDCDFVSLCRTCPGINHCSICVYYRQLCASKFFSTNISLRDFNRMITIVINHCYAFNRFTIDCNFSFTVNFKCNILR